MDFATAWRLRTGAKCLPAAGPRGVSACRRDRYDDDRAPQEKARLPRRRAGLKGRAARVRSGGAQARGRWPPRFGFTVTKRVAKKAVERNRMRRRLREAVRLDAENAQAGHDYVLVARRSALIEPFTDLKAALGQALRQAADFPNSGRSDARRTGR